MEAKSTSIASDYFVYIVAGGAEVTYSPLHGNVFFKSEVSDTHLLVTDRHFAAVLRSLILKIADYAARQVQIYNKDYFNTEIAGFLLRKEDADVFFQDSHCRCQAVEEAVAAITRLALSSVAVGSPTPLTIGVRFFRNFYKPEADSHNC
jgi:hypothetical protein